VLVCAVSLLLLGQVGSALAKPEPAPTPTPKGFETTAESAVLMEPTTGTIIFEKNAHRSLPPASVTKLMTLLVASEAVEQGKCSLKDRVKATEEAASLGGSQIYLEPGEEFSFEDLMIAVAVGSANDASVAVAEHVAGSHDEFVTMMNAKQRLWA
jgi:D-alanyl-D-alanine carboxypeptidase (penicillin-binding protein 5/6)